jgi:hypothetical protein
MNSWLFILFYLFLSGYTLGIGAKIVSIKNSSENDKEKIENMGKVGIGMTIAGSIACFLGIVFIVLKVKSGMIL